MSSPLGNYLIVGTAGADNILGTEDMGYSAIGTIVSGGDKETSDKLEIKDRYGNVVAVIYFNDKHECTIEVIFDSTVTLPGIGDTISVAGLVNVIVDSIEKKWEQAKEKMVSIAATMYPLVTIS